MTPWVNPPPAVLSALLAIDNHVALGIVMAGRSAEGVAQFALTCLPSCTVAKTAQMGVVALAAFEGTAVCVDGCAGGICINRHPGTFVPAPVYLAATALAAANPYLNAAIGTTAATGGVAGGAEQCMCGHFMPRLCTDAELHMEGL